jgi:hypothetical protein
MSLPVLQEVVERFDAQELAEARRKATYGHIRPVISAEFNAHRFVAVDSTLHFSPRWNTFADFLDDYFRHSFGSGWGQAELAKPLEQRHEAMRWYDHVCRRRAEGVAGPDGLFSIPKDGTIAAFLNLAYDLYVLRDHGKLQKQVSSGFADRTTFVARGTSFSSLPPSSFAASTLRTKTRRTARLRTPSSRRSTG